MHAAGEWADLGQVRDYADALVDTIRAFCGQEGRPAAT
jgi:hypothetical protein